MDIIKIKTQAFEGQNFGTSGLRKKVKIFMQTNYLENFMQSIANGLDIKNKQVVIGGDGRYFNYEAILTTIKILVANGVKKIYVGQNGLFSTPALSYFIIKNQLDYGIIFSASHNPAGENGDFGVKVNVSNGLGIPENISNNIHKISESISDYYILTDLNLNLQYIGVTKVNDTTIEVVDCVSDYVTYMQQIFNFTKIKNLLNSGFALKYEAFHAVTGIYAKAIFHDVLGVPLSNLYNIDTLPDFGGLHADPNRIYAKHLIELSKSHNAPDIIFASDGDGDRNLIIGKNIVVSPSDSLAIIVYYSHLIDFYKNPKGVARSLPTGRAVDAVAQSLKLNYYAVPTGWKFFGNLLYGNKITFCGEESCGTGSLHCGEKDGIWAMLFWLNIIAETGLSVEQIVYNLWQKFGRYYFIRLDYEGINNQLCEEIFTNVKNLHKTSYQHQEVTVSKFNYQDSVTLETTNTNIYVINIGDNTRIVVRQSGTSTDKATIRIYVDSLEKSNLYLDNNTYFKDIVNFIIANICNNIKPTIID